MLLLLVVLLDCLLGLHNLAAKLVIVLSHLNNFELDKFVHFGVIRLRLALHRRAIAVTLS